MKSRVVVLHGIVLLLLVPVVASAYTYARTSSSGTMSVVSGDITATVSAPSSTQNTSPNSDGYAWKKFLYQAENDGNDVSPENVPGNITGAGALKPDNWIEVKWTHEGSDTGGVPYSITGFVEFTPGGSGSSSVSGGSTFSGSYTIKVTQIDFAVNGSLKSIGAHTMTYTETLTDNDVWPHGGTPSAETLNVSYGIWEEHPPDALLRATTSNYSTWGGVNELVSSHHQVSSKMKVYVKVHLDRPTEI